MPSINGTLTATAVTTTEGLDTVSHDLVQFAGTVTLPGNMQSPIFTFSVFRPHNVNVQPGDAFTVTITKV